MYYTDQIKRYLKLTGIDTILSRFSVLKELQIKNIGTGQEINIAPYNI